MGEFNAVLAPACFCVHFFETLLFDACKAKQINMHAEPINSRYRLTIILANYSAHSSSSYGRSTPPANRLEVIEQAQATTGFVLLRHVIQIVRHTVVLICGIFVDRAATREADGAAGCKAVCDVRSTPIGVLAAPRRHSVGTVVARWCVPRAVPSVVSENHCLGCVPVERGGWLHHHGDKQRPQSKTDRDMVIRKEG